MVDTTSLPDTPGPMEAINSDTADAQPPEFDLFDWQEMEPRTTLTGKKRTFEEQEWDLNLF